MTMSVAFIVPIRDKIEHLEHALTSALAQSYERPLTIVLSDQGSTDGSREMSRKMAGGYAGPHDVRVVDAPDAPRGNAGINAQLNFLNETLEHDIVVMGTADDYHHPDRVSEVMKLFQKTRVDYVATNMAFLSHGHVWLPPTDHEVSGLLPPDYAVQTNIGCGATSAWRRSMARWAGPLPPEVVQDLVLPVCAEMRNGVAYSPLVLHVFRISEGNTGVGWQHQNESDGARKQELQKTKCEQRVKCYEWLLELGNRKGTDRRYLQLVENRLTGERADYDRAI